MIVVSLDDEIDLLLFLLNKENVFWSFMENSICVFELCWYVYLGFFLNK